MKVKAYRRKNGIHGIRNHKIVLPMIGCVNETARKIAGKDAILIDHYHGCDMLNSDADYLYEQYIRTCTHQNVGSVILVTMDCCPCNATALCNSILATGRNCVVVNIHKFKSEGEAVSYGKVELINFQKVEPVELDMPLVFAVHCGGTTPDSVEKVNKPLGALCDKLIDEGNSVIFGEDWEMIENPKLFMGFCHDNRTRTMFKSDMHRMHDEYLIRYPGEKWPPKLPADCTENRLLKTGSKPIKIRNWQNREMFETGRYYIPGPNSDIASITNLALAGAHYCFFATGRGSPVGNAIVPVEKFDLNTNWKIARYYHELTASEIWNHYEWQYHIRGVIW